MTAEFWELLIVGVLVGISGLTTGLRIGSSWTDEAFERGEAYGRACGEIERLRALCGEAAFHATNHLSLATAISYQPSDAGMAECLPDIRANRDRLRAASKGEQ